MPDKVIDASALAAILFAEPDADVILEMVKNTTLSAPSLLPYELSNVCLQKIRRHPSKRAMLIQGLDFLTQIRITYCEVNSIESVELAEQNALTAYDAAYLWLANTLDCPLITLDRKLAKAARKVY
ncbi:MAG: ribonuclease VapC [Nitrospirales bacterium]|nr:MAG: ribonuclease VapC [Nitrospirales bacterium]